MALPDPIVILGSPRSGTSLAASIFAAHGVWTGTSRAADAANPHGYYENVMLAETRYAMGHGDGLDPAHVESLMRDDGYKDGPWLVKHSPPTWRAWRRFSPKWVLVYRNPQQVVESRIRCGQWDMTAAEHWVAVMTDIATMSAIDTHYEAAMVCPDRLFRGEWDEISDAFDFCGLGFDEAKTRRLLDPAIWHKETVFAPV